MTPRYKASRFHCVAMLTNSPVPCVISFIFLGDLQNYTFLERFVPTESEK